MQKNIFLLSVWLIMQAAVQAQIIAGNAFIKGNYAEVGVSGLGGFEGASTGGGVPGGFHPRTLGGGIFGMVANPQMNGWSAPNFDGEFIGETYYENGWGFDFYPAGGGSPLSIRNDLYGINDVAGAVSNYQSMPGYVSVDFTGNYVSTGFDLSFLINYRINTNDLFFTTTVSVTNNHTDTIPAFYFHRTCNADNNAPLTLVTATTNTIESQATGTSITARVSSTQSTPWLSYIGLVGYDPAFRAGISPIFSATATAVWSATGGVLGTTGATTTADQPISLAFRKLNFLPGETTTFTYYTVFSPDVVPNIEASIYGEYEGAGHVVHDSLADQVYACGAVDISLEGFYRDNHNWTWTPNTYLSTDTGVAVTSTPLDTVVYTITGTGLDTVVYTITMIP
ncbi:MAG TPA: hypothetical protein VD905_19390, partial [Flavobacteriales bacterium]|nr:hypothetical protein [Flavobacteriales bacterium]